jgi:hypothetical protein
MIYEITWVCASPRHARGKIATLAVYIRVGGRWERRALRRKSALRTRRNAAARSQKDFADAATSGSMADLARAMGGDPRQGNPWCKLCGAAPVGQSEPTDFELEWFAAQDKSIITVTQLNTLRLRPKR